MRRARPRLSTVLLLSALSGLSLPLMSGKALGFQATKTDDHPVVIIDTTAGPITVELDRTKSPITVENFLKYVDKGFYDGLAFHRVMPGFMIQTGGMQDINGTLQEKKEGAFPPIKNESKNGLKHIRGSIAMARTRNPDSASSQFFIDHATRPDLDQQPGGYTIFGKVVDGMDVVDAIAKTQTTTKTDVYGNSHEDVPVKPILIKSTKRKG